MNWKTHSLVKQDKVSDFFLTGLAHSLIKSSGLLNNSNLLFFYLGVSFWRVLVRFLSLGAHRARIQIVLVISGRLPGHRTFPPVPLHHRTQYALLRSTHNSTSRPSTPSPPKGQTRRFRGFLQRMLPTHLRQVPANPDLSLMLNAISFVITNCSLVYVRLVLAATSDNSAGPHGCFW